YSVIYGQKLNAPQPLVEWHVRYFETQRGEARRSLQHFDRHAFVQGTGAFGDQVLAEEHAILVPAIAQQCRQRLLIGAALGAGRIDGGNRATRTGLDHAKIDGADADTLPRSEER